MLCAMSAELVFLETVVAGVVFACFPQLILEDLIWHNISDPLRKQQDYA